MIGRVQSYNKEVQTGVIEYQQQFFEFHIDVWLSKSMPEVGSDVDFLEQDGIVTEVNLLGAYTQDLRPVKSRWIAAILGFVLGGAGIHRLYLGYYGIAVMQLIVTLLTGGYGVLGDLSKVF
jgi:hypothetical protein